MFAILTNYLKPEHITTKVIEQTLSSTYSSKVQGGKYCKVELSVHVGYLLNKHSRACCGPTRNLQCAMVEKRENSLWLFNQPVVALGVVCLCSTASNK